MTISHLPVGAKRLFQGWAFPGWLLLGWKLLNFASNLAFVASGAAPVWRFLNSPLGNLLTIVIGLAWLFAVVLWPRRGDESRSVADVPRPRLEKALRQQGIYIGPSGIPAQLATDTVTVRLEIFSCSDIELRYIRATLSAAEIGEFMLESAEPHQIKRLASPFSKTLEKTLSADEAARCRQAGLAMLRGTAKFEDSIESNFSFGVWLKK